MHLTCSLSLPPFLPLYHFFRKHCLIIHYGMYMYSIITLGTETTVKQNTDGPASVEEMDSSRQPNQNISYRL